MVAVSVARKRTDPVVPPRAGPPALIDPRRDDPPAFLVLDLVDTFYLVPSESSGSAEHARGAFTVELLALNGRDYLPRARWAAYQAFLGVLERYVARKREGAPTAELRLSKRAIQDLPHPTVWAEMKRQRSTVAELDALFGAAPEALRW